MCMYIYLTTKGHSEPADVVRARLGGVQKMYIYIMHVYTYIQAYIVRMSLNKACSPWAPMHIFQPLRV